MHRERIPPHLAAIVLIAVVATAVRAGEISVNAGRVSGEWDDGTRYSSETLTLRLAAGDRIRVRAHLPFVRLDEADAVAWTLAGPTPIPPDRRRAGPGSGNEDPGTGNEDPGTGNGSGGGSGEGEGSGNAGAMLQAATLAGEPTSGLGDLRVGVSARLFGRGADLDHLSAELDFKAPTGDDEEGLGTGAWDARLGLAGEHRGWHGTTFGGIGWTRFGDPEWIDLRDGADAYVGFETEPLRAGLSWSAWIDGARSAVSGVDDPIRAGVGVRKQARRPWQGSVWAGVTDGAPDLGFTIGWSSDVWLRPGRWGDRR
jgi:hypothetical protein